MASEMNELEMSEKRRADGALNLPDDPIESPAHYTAHPSGVECIQITEHMSFNVGNAIKYLWRAGLKTKDATEDLCKAQWYVQREIARLEDVSEP